MEPSNKGLGGNFGIMTVHDAAAYLHISEAKIHRMANERQVPTHLRSIKVNSSIPGPE